MKIWLDGLNSWYELAEERTSKLEDRAIEIMQLKNKEKIDWIEINRTSKKYGLCLSTPTYISWECQRRGERERNRKNNKVPYLLESINLYVQEAQGTPNKINTKRSTPKHTSKNAERPRKNLENREWRITYKGTLIWYLIKNKGSQKAVRWHIQSAERIKIVNQDSYILKN